MKNHKLFYGSSYDRVDFPVHKWYYNIYAKTCRQINLYLRLVFKGLFSVSKPSQKRFGERLQKTLLFSPVQIRMEQNHKGLLVWKKDPLLQATQQERIRGVKWTMAGWKKARQKWLCSNMETRTSKLRWGWVCKRTSLSDGAENWTIIKVRGGSASC